MESTPAKNILLKLIEFLIFLLQLTNHFVLVQYLFQLCLKYPIFLCIFLHSSIQPHLLMTYELLPMSINVVSSPSLPPIFLNKSFAYGKLAYSFSSSLFSSLNALTCMQFLSYFLKQFDHSAVLWRTNVPLIS